MRLVVLADLLRYILIFYVRGQHLRGLYRINWIKLFVIVLFKHVDTTFNDGLRRYRGLEFRLLLDIDHQYLLLL